MLPYQTHIQLDDGRTLPIDMVWIVNHGSTDLCDLCVKAGDAHYKREMTHSAADSLRELLLKGGTFDQRLHKLPEQVLAY